MRVGPAEIGWSAVGARGVRGHAPPEKFLNLAALKCTFGA